MCKTDEDFRSEVKSTLQRYFTVDDIKIKSWSFFPGLLEAITKLHDKYKGKVIP